MAKPSVIDWDLARTLYSQGLKPTAIAERLNCRAATIHQRAYREKWSDTLVKSQALVEEDWGKRAEAWRQRIARLAESRLTIIEREGAKSLSISRLRELTELEDLTDRIARRNLGLDQQSAAGTTINIGIMSPVSGVKVQQNVQQEATEITHKP